MEEQKQTPSPMTPAGEDTSEAAPAQAETSAVEDVAAQIAALETKAREHYDLFLRATAECENIRRRAREDVAKAHKFAIETFADHLLPVMDSLQAALSDGSGDIDKLREGVELTARQLSNAFEKGKILELNPVGEKFDPYRHQAISMVSSEQEANTVVAVLQRGYLIADRVLRPALVTVSAPNCSERNPEGADPLQNPTASGPLADKVGGPDGPDGPGGPDDDFKGLAC